MELVDVRPDGFVTRFGPMSSAPHFMDGELTNGPVQPVIPVLPKEVGDAMQPGGDDSFGGVLATATPDGFFRIDSPSGSWVWELFPARWSDGLNHAFYIGVWRD